MLGDEKLLSEAVAVCSTSSWLVHTTVVRAGTVRSAGTKLKFSTLTDGPPVASTGCAGFAGTSVDNTAGETGVGSPEAGAILAAAAGEQGPLSTVRMRNS